MAETYTVRYEITPAAMTAAIRLHQAMFLARYRIVMVAIAIAGVVVAFAVDSSLGLTIAIVGVLLLAMTWMQFADRWLFGNRARGVVGGTCEYLVDDRGIHYQNPLGSGTLAWSALTKVSANDETIVLGRDRVMAAYIPTTAFASHAERESFLTFARAHVGARAATA